MYLLNREQHTVGQRTPSSKPSVSLSAPDILPLHCTIRRHQPPGPEQAESRLVLEPVAGAPVSVNFSEVGGRAVVLRHGDLLSLGLYYLLLFKDPAQAQPLPAQALARLRAVPRSCRTCGAALRARGAPRSGSTRAALPRPRPLHLEFEPEVEDALLQRIMTLIEPSGDDHKLAPAFLLCLCIQHAATRLDPGSFGQLLLKIATAIRETVWVSSGVPVALGGAWGRSWGRAVGARRMSPVCPSTPREPGVSAVALCLWGVSCGIVHSGPQDLPKTQPQPDPPKPRIPIWPECPVLSAWTVWGLATTVLWSRHQLGSRGPRRVDAGTLKGVPPSGS